MDTRTDPGSLGVLGKYSDVAVAAALLVLNAVLGFAQERRAAGGVAALRRRLQVSARVLRDSSWQVVAARELVLVVNDTVKVMPTKRLMPAASRKALLLLDFDVLTSNEKYGRVCDPNNSLSHTSHECTFEPTPAVSADD